MDVTLAAGSGWRDRLSRRAVLHGIALSALGGYAFRFSGEDASAARVSLAEEEAPAMSTVRTDDGVNLAYRVRGEGPLNLLFLHGWAGSGASFDGVISAMDLTGLRAITYDMRGHGDSDKPATGYDLDRLTEDALAVADAAGAEDFVVVGYSLGSKFAQYLPVMAPDRVLGQILVSGAPASAIPLPTEVHQDWVSRAGDREKLFEVERALITGPFDQALMDRWLDDAVKVPRSVLDATLNTFEQADFAARLPEVRTPTLVIGGVHDPIFTPAALRQGVVAPLDHVGARLSLIDANHVTVIEAPSDLAALIEAFIAGLGSASL